jgi:ribonuclease R
MLPFELSADACSLKEGELRPCLVAEMIFSKDGNKKSHRFLRANMRSAAKLAYEEAQAAIDGKPGGKAGEILDTVLRPLWGAYAAVSKARDARSPLDLDMPERRIMFSPEGQITGITTKERLEAHRLIEEFMIQANVAAAETLEQMQSPVVYRVHDTPSEAKIAAFAEFLQTLDMKWTVGERPQTHKFNKLLAEIRGGDYEGMIQQMVLRSQAQAIYSEENLGHLGLNLARYSHFTSPIRRYPDIIAHRLLFGYQEGHTMEQICQWNMEKLDAACKQSSKMEVTASEAERASIKYKQAEWMESQIGKVFPGVISGLTDFGMFVEIKEYKCEGMIRLNRIEGDHYEYDSYLMAVIGSKFFRQFKMGDEVQVLVANANKISRMIDLELILDNNTNKKQHDRKRRNFR